MDIMEMNDIVGLPPAVDGRQQDRVAFRVPVRIISHGVLGDKFCNGMAVDISHFGVAFETKAELDLDDVVEIIFEKNNKTIFRSSARLLYRAGQRYGASFGGRE